MTELQEGVARSADTADLHATVPTLLLELQTLLGSLTSTVTGQHRAGAPAVPTGGRSGHRASGSSPTALFLLADQTGVDLATAVQLDGDANWRRKGHQAQTSRSRRIWPFEG